MCQIVGNCFVEDPFARQKEILWHARWCVEVLRPDATYKDIEAYLQSEHLSITPQQLGALLNRALDSLKHEGGGPRREAAWRKLLRLVDAATKDAPCVATAGV